VPRSPQEVSAAWLTGALCGGVPGASVEEVRSAGGDAGTTTRRALLATYNAQGAAAGLPTRLFVKCTTTLAQRLMLGLGGLIHGEPGFYTEVRPGLAIEAPAGYFGAVDERSWHSVVVIEDVAATQGASFWTPATTIDRSGIEDLLGGAAAWHGALWNRPALEAWPWLRTPAQQMRLIDTLIGLANRLPAGARRAREVLPPSLRTRQTDLYEGLRRSMAIAATGDRTYLHGDLHVANTYLTRHGRRGVADWQTGLKGSWAHDFTYLLVTALAVEDRRAWESELLDLYLDRVAAAGGAPPPREAAWLAYRRATFYPYFAWTYTLGRSRLQPAFQPDAVSLTLIGRIAAGMEDLASLSAVGL
jgi:hypothetical protein